MFTCPSPFHTISSQQAAQFGAAGFVHAAPDASGLKKRWLTLKEKSYGPLVASDPNGLRVLVAPVDWPKNFPNPAGAAAASTLNPWRYNSSAPTNNLRSFDLWAEYYIGKQKKVIGNWKE